MTGIGTVRFGQMKLRLIFSAIDTPGGSVVKGRMRLQKHFIPTAKHSVGPVMLRDSFSSVCR